MKRAKRDRVLIINMEVRKCERRAAWVGGYHDISGGGEKVAIVVVLLNAVYVYMFRSPSNEIAERT